MLFNVKSWNAINLDWPSSSMQTRQAHPSRLVKFILADWRSSSLQTGEAHSKIRLQVAREIKKKHESLKSGVIICLFIKKGNCKVRPKCKKLSPQSFLGKKFGSILNGNVDDY